jgi:GNAT superfamily N-acetyltransferase
MPSPPLQITHATTRDIPTIRALAHATWPATFGAILSPEQIEYMLEWMYSVDALREQMETQGHVFLLAMANAQPAGYASYELGYQGTTATKLHKIYIHPAMQGHGIGRALIAAVRDAAMRHGQREITLNVNRYNRAIQFYEGQGFTVTGAEDLDIGHGFYMNDVIMTLVLERPPIG